MTLYVINPNSTQAVTDGIDKAIDPFRRPDLSIRCLTLPEGPPGIETDQHVADVVAPLNRLMEQQSDASAFVIACFSDPGVGLFRSTFDAPVIGIREAAVEVALSESERFGVIAIGEASISRHVMAFEMLGVTDRLAGDRPLNLSVTDLMDEKRCSARLVEVAKDLRDIDGAEVLIMGCAGMAGYRAPLEAAVGIPVIEPCRAAVALVCERLILRA